MRFAAFLAFIAIVASSGATRAMDFTIQGTNLKGTGPIVAGDAERLREALRQTPRQRHGLKLLALDSPGGSVDAAFEMAKVMDSVGVGTLVLPGDSCASACAAILFVAGRTRIAAPGSRLGFHTCYNSISRVGDEICNHRIAAFGLAHGIAYNSVFVFMHAAGPDGMIWFSGQSADCWGFNRWPEGMTPAGWEECLLKALRGSGRNPGR